MTSVESQDAVTLAAPVGWTGTYNNVNGVLKEFVPSALGLNPIPDNILEQFNAVARATADLIATKVCGHGPGTKFNIVLSGSGDSGHKGSNTLSISITQL